MSNDSTELKWHGPWEPYELYDQAVLHVNNPKNCMQVPEGLSWQDQKVWWTAQFAARQTAIALLNRAFELNIDPGDYEELRKVAAIVAAD